MRPAAVDLPGVAPPPRRGRRMTPLAVTDSDRLTQHNRADRRLRAAATKSVVDRQVTHIILYALRREVGFNIAVSLAGGSSPMPPASPQRTGTAPLRHRRRRRLPIRGDIDDHPCLSPKRYSVLGIVTGRRSRTRLKVVRLVMSAADPAYLISRTKPAQPESIAETTQPVKLS